MRLPYSVEIGYINYLLSTANKLSENQPNCDAGILVDTCKSQVFNGRIDIKYHELLNICNFAKLLELYKGRTNLTNLGIDFLRLNPSLQFEFTEGQKEYFSTKLLFSGPWSSQIKMIFSNFIANTTEITFEFYIEEGNKIKPEFLAQLHILNYLGILVRKEDSYQVNSKYVKHVVALRNEYECISQEELEEQLRRNREQGKKAEELIINYEKARLTSINRVAEADRVVLISQLETNAGFDIKSYNGDEPTLEHNRFIEVKSSENRDLSFHWSNNEMSIAKQLGEQYWIYYIGGFKIDQKIDDIEETVKIIV